MTFIGQRSRSKVKVKMSSSVNEMGIKLIIIIIKILKSNISKTVRDREMVSIEAK